MKVTCPKCEVRYSTDKYVSCPRCQEKYDFDNGAWKGKGNVD